MKAVVVYESMFGNTRKIAEAIAEGIGSDATACAVGLVTRRDLDVDLLVVGGPTHVHSLSRFRTRRAAEEKAEQGTRHLDSNASVAVGLREWLELRALAGLRVAAFDTRMQGPPMLTGRASKGIARRLKDAGGLLIAPPMSFLVTKDDVLVDGELDRAAAFGKTLAEQVALSGVR